MINKVIIVMILASSGALIAHKNALWPEVRSKLEVAKQQQIKSNLANKGLNLTLESNRVPPPSKRDAASIRRSVISFFHRTVLGIKTWIWITKPSKKQLASKIPDSREKK